MFGAPSGGFGADGHQGFEPATVLPIVPPNGFALPAAMLSSRFLDATAVAPLVRRGLRHRAACALPKTIIRIIIMIISDGDASSDAAAARTRSPRRDPVTATAQPRDHGRAAPGRRGDVAHPQPRGIVDRGAVPAGRRH